MINCRGPAGSFFDDRAIEPFGTKIMGGYQFRLEEGEPGRTTGHVSPGHNSAYYDAETGKYYLIFHTRFNVGTGHEVRVHEMFLNDDGWFVVSPFRFDGGCCAGAARIFTPEQIVGSFKLINHGQDINTRPKISVAVNFEADGTIVGPHTGTWRLEDDGSTININLDGTDYNGRVLRTYDRDHRMWVTSFTVMSEEGIALWGAGVAIE